MRKPIGFRRGDLVTVASSGDYGKPRPALIVQAAVNSLAAISETGTANQFGLTVASPGYDAVANLPGWNGPGQ